MGSAVVVMGSAGVVDGLAAVVVAGLAVVVLGSFITGLECSRLLQIENRGLYKYFDHILFDLVNYQRSKT